MASKIKINHKAIAEILKHDMRKPIDEMAAKIAANVDVSNLDGAQVTVRSYETDRAAAAISIAHPAGLAQEAKHGSLRKAAAQEGLEVRAMKNPK